LGRNNKASGNEKKRDRRTIEARKMFLQKHEKLHKVGDVKEGRTVKRGVQERCGGKEWKKNTGLGPVRKRQKEQRGKKAPFLWDVTHESNANVDRPRPCN